ncbi:heat shock protein 30-like [Thunnus maccoyii]|uniref:heat shock protein 30-like n=1 Tax=Thunnus maccoyii TaxID=8240 RepID=UPI001C4BCA6D|nr:heat shock protein 30-like [Thunnus maccoyii]
MFHLATRGLTTKNTVKMLCSHGFQSALSPYRQFYWPVRSLWPEVKPLIYQDDLLQRNLQEMHRSLELMHKLQYKILEEMEPFQTSVATQPVSYQLEKKGEHFVLTLDTQGFSPEELSVKQVGNKLRVSGKTEKKQEDGKGSYSYRRREFRQEFDLPKGLNPETISCYLAPDGKLHIQAAKALCVEEAERELTIKRSLEEKTQQSPSSQPEDSSTETDNSTQDKPKDMH